MATQTLFDRWTHAAFVLDVSGRMVSMNAAASRLVDSDSGIWLDRGGHLRLPEPGNGSTIEAALRRFARLGDSLDLTAADGVRDVFALPRRAPQPPLQAMASPLPAVDSLSELGGERGRSLLVVFDPLKVERTPVGWLCRHYGLTHAEGRLAQAIINGVPLADAAAQFGIQLSTARSRLKIILGKTGCNRQVDLAAGPVGAARQPKLTARMQSGCPPSPGRTSRRATQ
jgi:DNA-binding CsgD family transcriptional regulator